MNFGTLEKATLAWAKDKGILVESPDQAVVQVGKMIEEVLELQNELIAIVETADDFEKSDDHFERSRMELGDVMVTVIITAYCAGLEPLECLQLALNKITKRTGNVVNGIFVKDIPPNDPPAAA